MNYIRFSIYILIVCWIQSGLVAQHTSSSPLRAKEIFEHIKNEQPEEFKALTDSELQPIGIEGTTILTKRDEILENCILSRKLKTLEGRKLWIFTGYLHQLDADSAKSLYTLAIKAVEASRNFRRKDLNSIISNYKEAVIMSDIALKELQRLKVGKGDTKGAQARLEAAIEKVDEIQTVLSKEQLLYDLKYKSVDAESDQTIARIEDRIDTLKHTNLFYNLNATFFVGTQYFSTYGERADPSVIAVNGTSSSFLSGPTKLLSAEFHQGLGGQDFYGITPGELFSRISFGSKDGSSLKGSEGFSGEIGFAGGPAWMRARKAVVRFFGTYGVSSLPDKSDNLGVDTRLRRSLVDTNDPSKGFTYSDAVGNRRFADHWRTGLTVLQFNQDAWNQSFVDLAYERDFYYLEPGRLALKGRLYFAKELAYVQLDLSRALHRGDRAVDSVALTLGIPFELNRVSKQLTDLFSDGAKK